MITHQVRKKTRHVAYTDEALEIHTQSQHNYKSNQNLTREISKRKQRESIGIIGFMTDVTQIQTTGKAYREKRSRALRKKVVERSKN